MLEKDLDNILDWLLSLNKSLTINHNLNSKGPLEVPRKSLGTRLPCKLVSNLAHNNCQQLHS